MNIFDYIPLYSYNLPYQLHQLMNSRKLPLIQQKEDHIFEMNMQTNPYDVEIILSMQDSQDYYSWCFKNGFLEAEVLVIEHTPYEWLANSPLFGKSSRDAIIDRTQQAIDNIHRFLSK